MKEASHFPSGRADTIVFEDHFDTSTLDRSKWIPAYLPDWTTPERAAARYELADSVLRLLITDDQKAWLPELEGGLRVSNLQTGHLSGAVGSPHGQHRSREGLAVRTKHAEQRLFVPRYCQLEMRARAQLNPWNLAGLWLIGFEDKPEHSGEIIVFEVFGYKIRDDASCIGRGIKRINDPHFRDELNEGELPVSIKEWHCYAMDWSSSGVAIYVDDQLVMQTD